MNKILYRIGLTALMLTFNVISYAQENPTSTAEYNLMIISDMHLGANHMMDPAPEKLDDKNDMDLNTYQNFMNQINQLLLSKQLAPEQILVLGDLTDHLTSSPIGNVDARMTQLHTNFSTMFQIDTMTGIPFAYVPGNNDSLAGNYKPFYTHDLTVHSPLEVAQNAGWQGFVSRQTTCDANPMQYPCMVTENQNGFYVEKLAPKLQLIALNTVLFSSRNTCTELCQDEINWLGQQLEHAQQNGDTVILAAHIPPGKDMYSGRLFWSETAHQQFLKTVAPYSTQVIAFFAGHSHMEESQLIQFKEKTPIPVIFTAGLSTSHGNAPAFKLVQLAFNAQTQTWHVKNYQTYHYLQNAFQFYYDAKTAYCKSDQDEIYLADCFAQFLSEHRLNAFQTIMNQYFTAGNPNYHAGQKNTNAEDLVTHWNA